jgi:hypothetical protein
MAISVQYRVRKCPPLVPIPNHINWVLEIHVNIIFPSMPRSYKSSLSIRSSSPPKPCMHISSPPIRVTCPANLILFYLITRIIFGDENRSSSAVFPPRLQTAINVFGPSTNGTFRDVPISVTMSVCLRLSQTAEVYGDLLMHSNSGRKFFKINGQFTWGLGHISANVSKRTV